MNDHLYMSQIKESVFYSTEHRVYWTIDHSMCRQWIELSFTSPVKHWPMRIDNNNEETLYTSPHSTNQHGPLLLAFLPRKNGHSQTTISSYRRRFYRSSMVIVRYQSVISYSFLFFFPPNYSVHKSGGSALRGSVFRRIVRSPLCVYTLDTR